MIIVHVANENSFTAYAIPLKAGEKPCVLDAFALPLMLYSPCLCLDESCMPCVLCSLFPVPWWAYHLGQHDGSWWLATLQPAALQSMPSRQRLGILNAAHDLLKHLGHKLKLFLPEMCALVLILLEGAALTPIAQVRYRQTPKLV